MLGSYTSQIGTRFGCCTGRFRRYAKNWMFYLSIHIAQIPSDAALILTEVVGQIVNPEYE